MQKAMVELFGVGVTAIIKQLSHIFGEGEFDIMVISEMETTTRHCALAGIIQSKDDAVNFQIPESGRVVNEF